MIKIFKDGINTREEIFSVVTPKVDVEKIVDDIIENVKDNGDKALFEYAYKFDKASLSSLEVSKEEILDAVNSVDKEFLEVLKRAKQNIWEFHQKQYREGFEIRITIGAKKDED